jgi:hypothetical protein
MNDKHKEGWERGLAVSLQLSDIVVKDSNFNDDDYHYGFMQAIKEWYDYTLEGIEPDWMKELPTEFTIH